jgi:hypothetical protein
MTEAAKEGIAECYGHYLALRREMARWLEQSVRQDGPGKNRGGEDEANYALAFMAHYLVSGDSAVKARLTELLEALANWVETDCEHGYEAEAEAHHGTEPFLLFLPRYLGLFPADEKAKGLLEDAAHHIGNWVEGVPPWYDWRRDVFYSYRIGSRLVGGDACFDFELAEHFRFIHLALAAHRTSGQARYAEWALRYGRARARRLVEADEPLPLLWDLAGRGLGRDELVTRQQRVMAADNHHVAGDPLAGIENMLASGAVFALGDLYGLEADEIFRQAALRLVEPLIDQLLDPYADPAAAALSYYRVAFGDDQLDNRIRSVLARMPAASQDEWAMVLPQRHQRIEPGVGRRNDMIHWGLWGGDGSVTPSQEPSTAALALAYQLDGKVEHASRAFATASVKLLMARRVLRGGREHTDMGGAVCSVAQGHGRNWGCGAVTGCYGPLLLGTREVMGQTAQLVEVRDANGALRLPEDILSLIRPGVGTAGQVLFFNASAAQVNIDWRPEGQQRWQRLDLGAGAVERRVL